MSQLGVVLREVMTELRARDALREQRLANAHYPFICPTCGLPCLPGEDCSNAPGPLPDGEEFRA